MHNPGKRPLGFAGVVTPSGAGTPSAQTAVDPERTIRGLTYEEDGQVVLAVKLQEMFGCETGPAVLQRSCR